MKFAIVSIGGLNTAILAHVRFEILDKISFQGIESTTPSRAITSWTSAWTGKSPAIHGRLPGLSGNKPKLPTVWTALEQSGFSVMTYHKEPHWQSEPDEKVDVIHFRIDDFSEAVVKGDMESAQAVLQKVDELIAGLTVPYLIISAYGLSKYTTALNVDKFLIGRQLMNLNGRDNVAHGSSLAYPINYNGKKPRPTHGIVINHIDRKGGYVESAHAFDLIGNLLMQLNKTKGIQAVSAQQLYDIGDRYYSDMPDVILRSPSSYTYFRSVGQKEAAVVEPYSRYAMANTGLIASSEPIMIDQIDSVMNVRKAILNGAKMTKRKGK